MFIKELEIEITCTKLEKEIFRKICKKERTMRESERGRERQTERERERERENE